MSNVNQEPAYHHVRDNGLTLSVPIPQGNAQWLDWHARRKLVRDVITRIRVVQHDGPTATVDPAATTADQDTILHALGLDPDSEAELLARWA
jgi:hypothetical protein